MNKIYKFSDAQWEFLSVMRLFTSPVSIDILTTLRPLSSTELLDIIERGKKLRIIKEFKSSTYSIKKNLPANMRKRVEQVHTAKDISHFLQQIESMNLSKSLSPSTYINLLSQSEKDIDAAQNVARRGMEALENGQLETAYGYLKQALYKLFNHLETTKSREIFIDAALEFSKICITPTRDIEDNVKFLEQVKILSENLGNKRAWTLANFHLAHFYFYSGRKAEAFKLFSIGKDAVEALGDQDIFNESAGALVYYFFRQGNYKQTIEVIDRVETNTNISGNILNLIDMTTFKAFSLVYTGNYYASLGYIKSHLRSMLLSEHHAAANFFRVILGTFSILVNQYEEAFTFLNSSLKQSYKENAIHTRYVAKGGLAFLNYRKKNYREAYLMMIDMMDEGKKVGISETFTSPWFLEMLVDFEKLGYDTIPGMEPQTQIQRILKEQNHHLQGVALRLRAMKASFENNQGHIIWRDLKKSEELLQEVGDPVQLAKTHMEMAVYKLMQGEKKAAYQLATDARHVLIEHGEDFLPDGLNPLFQEEHNLFEKEEVDQIQEEVAKAFYTMISELPLSSSFEQGLEKLLIVCNKFFGAEQGAIFWSDDGTANNLFLRIPYNIGPPVDKGSPKVIHNMQFVKQALEKKQPVMEHEQITSRYTKTPSRIGSILCLPFQTARGAAGVIWYRNSYSQDSFTFVKENQLQKICDYLSNYISNIAEFNHQIKAATESTLKKAAQIDSSSKQQFTIRGNAMTQIINHAKIIAETDSTVLLLGETGVGKELLARWIHSHSNRRHWPIVTIDCTTIPETLIESELFGYEKGSFTGADRKKIGQIELADKGTLFIDEIGEIPLSIQVKLLRVLQEKKIKRIGGHQMISSDFRLIAATNRNLLQELENGSFRRDLYYRLSVLPITIPPLRNRKDEIIELSKEFIIRYEKKHNRSNLLLSEKDCQQLIAYAWPGNIRELENTIERSVLMSTNSNFNLLLPSNATEKDDHVFADSPTLDDVQRRYILYTLDKTGGRISGPRGAAKILGIERTTLTARMKKLGIY